MTKKKSAVGQMHSRGNAGALPLRSSLCLISYMFCIFQAAGSPVQLDVAISDSNCVNLDLSTVCQCVVVEKRTSNIHIHKYPGN